MIYQGSVNEIRSKRLSKDWGYLVVCMRFYPRFISKSLIHEYHHALSPAEDLFNDFKKALASGCTHNEAFDRVNYEQRFEISTEAHEELKRLSEVSRAKDVYLLCQCAKGEKCHRHLLLLMAEQLYRATVEKVKIEYPLFQARLPAMR